MASETWRIYTSDSDYYEDGERKRTVSLCVRVVDATSTMRDTLVCNIHQDGPEPTETERGRARKIAAANEMLDALNAVLVTLVWAGRCPFGLSYHQSCDCNYHAAVESLRSAIAKATKPAK